MDFIDSMLKNPLGAICPPILNTQLVPYLSAGDSFYISGFVEYLLDRSVSDMKEAKEARYDIIKRLARSSAFESNILTRLQKYVEDGPFYMETNLQVAMEEGD